YPPVVKYYYYYMAYCRSCRRRFFIVSGMYKSISIIIVSLFGLMPYRLKNLLYDVLQKSVKIKPWLKKYILKKYKMERT
ncbi:MAG: hypothetical protein PHV60_00320, partial [bacterium]|nr:hypothetical protein [bacterium]